MSFQEIINNFLESNFFQEGIAIAQSAVMVIITYLLNKAKAKATQIQNNANELLDKQNKKLEDLKGTLGVTKEELQKTTDTVKEYIEKQKESENNNKLLLEMLTLFILDSKSVAANTKLAVSKLLSQITNKEAVEHIQEVIEESKEEEVLTLEQVEEIKQEVEEQIQESKQNVDSITQQTLDIYNEINND